MSIYFQGKDNTVEKTTSNCESEILWYPSKRRESTAVKFQSWGDSCLCSQKHDSLVNRQSSNKFHTLKNDLKQFSNNVLCHVMFCFTCNYNLEKNLSFSKRLTNVKTTVQITTLQVNALLLFNIMCVPQDLCVRKEYCNHLLWVLL